MRSTVASSNLSRLSHDGTARLDVDHRSVIRNFRGACGRAPQPRRAAPSYEAKPRIIIHFALLLVLEPAAHYRSVGRLRYSRSSVVLLAALRKRLCPLRTVQTGSA